MDGNNNNITVFKQTEFGALIHDATGLFNRGRYEEAKPLWEEILRRDANYWYAYIGLGNSYLQQGEYETAMDYFYMNSRSGYNRAFKQFRMNYIRDNFDMFATIALILVVAFYAIGLVRKRQKIKKQKLEAGGKRE